MCDVQYESTRIHTITAGTHHIVQRRRPHAPCTACAQSTHMARPRTHSMFDHKAKCRHQSSCGYRAVHLPSVLADIAPILQVHNDQIAHRHKVGHSYSHLEGRRGGRRLCAAAVRMLHARWHMRCRSPRL
jgi:hypothetical protein